MAFSRKLPIVDSAWKYISKTKQPLEATELLNQPNLSGGSPLEVAITNNSTPIAKYFLALGAEIHPLRYLLHHAAAHGNRSIAKVLLRRTKDPNPKDSNGETPLFAAIKSRRWDFIESYFQECAKLAIVVDVNATNKHSETLLLLAISLSSSKISELLLSKGATSIPNTLGTYPIHLAAILGLDSVVKVLVNHDGAKSSNNWGCTALYCAANNGKLGILKFLATHSPGLINVADKTGYTPLMVALKHKYYDIANYLLDSKADCRSHADDGINSLHVAVTGSNVKMVQRLLDLGVDGNATTNQGQTVTHYAVRGDSWAQMEIIEELVKRGYNQVNILDQGGISVLHSAAIKGHLKILQRLESLGGTLEVESVFGYNLVLIASVRGQLEILKYLRRRGADFTYRAQDGLDALALAAESYPETVKLLLDIIPERANDQANIYQDSPLLIAARAKNHLAVRYLLEAGADPFRRNLLGLCTWDYACHHQQTQEEIEKVFGKFDVDEKWHSGNERRSILMKTVNDCVAKLTELTQSPKSSQSTTSLFVSESVMILLSQTLLHLGDQKAFKICHMALLSILQPVSIGNNWDCSMCQTELFAVEHFVCKSCPGLVLLCKKCMLAYNSSGKCAPLALKVLVSLEETVRPIRAVLQDTLLSTATAAMYLNDITREWLTQTTEAYDSWVLKYSSQGELVQIPRPGERCLRMIQEMYSGLLQRGASIDFHLAEDVELIKTTLGRFCALQSEHRADKAPLSFTCKDHDFLSISQKCFENINAAAISGTVTLAFLSTLLSKYDNGKENDESTEHITESKGKNHFSTSPLGMETADVPEPASTLDLSERSHRTSLKEPSQANFWSPPNQHLSKGSDTTQLLKRSRTLPQSSEVAKFPRRSMSLRTWDFEGSKALESTKYTLPSSKTKGRLFKSFDIDQTATIEYASLAKAYHTLASNQVPSARPKPEADLEMVEKRKLINPGKPKHGQENQTWSNVTNADDKGVPAEMLRKFRMNGEDKEIIKSAYTKCYGYAADDTFLNIWAAAVEITEVIKPGWKHEYFLDALHELETTEASRLEAERLDESLYQSTDTDG
ncbi:ankyrin [Microthyrium microscopicum]|uniref:Ankyrin n=1 Tax=Microthyrium microscopicum TaxID=703497 RepID=A0A6A6U8B1_9PEZI|nr:ankyrin [Microthyrium microscopicum]